MMLDHVLLGLDYRRESGLSLGFRIRSLHEQYRRTGCHDMAVLHVELGLAGPACVIAGRDGSVRLDDREPGGSRQAEGLVEHAQVVAHRWRAERVDDDYGLTLPVDPLFEKGTFV